MIEDELNYPDTMRKRYLDNKGRQEYNKWVDETELGKVYNTFSQRFQNQHVYCYPSTSEPPNTFLCIGQHRNHYFYIKRSTR